MANKSSLDSFVYYAYGFVNFDNKALSDVPDLLVHFVKFATEYNRVDKYYFIAHTETDVLHIHFVLSMSSQTRLMTIFNKLYKALENDVRDVNAITIDKAANFNFQISYILHRDKQSIASGKKQYDIEDIVTNDTITSIEGILSSKKGNCDAYFLRDAVLDSLNEFDLMVKLGLPVYHRYRFEIQRLQEMRAQLILMRNEEKERDDLSF